MTVFTNPGRKLKTIRTIVLVFIIILALLFRRLISPYGIAPFNLYGRNGLIFLLRSFLNDIILSMIIWLEGMLWVLDADVASNIYAMNALVERLEQIRNGTLQPNVRCTEDRGGIPMFHNPGGKLKALYTAFLYIVLFVAEILLAVFFFSIGQGWAVLLWILAAALVWFIWWIFGLEKLMKVDQANNIYEMGCAMKKIEQTLTEEIRKGNVVIAQQPKRNPNPGNEQPQKQADNIYSRRWQCRCGRIHPGEISVCECGVSRRELMTGAQR